MNNNQIIQKYVNIFEDFVKTNFLKENEYYIYNSEVFKKLLFNEKITEFLSLLEEYYYKNKTYYLKRNPLTMNQFNTILRQIMSKNNIYYEKKVKYIMSKYQVEYLIYFKNSTL